MIAILLVTKNLLEKKLVEKSAVLGEAIYLSGSTEFIEILTDPPGENVPNREDYVLVKTKVSPQDLLLLGYLNETSPVQLTEYPLEPDPVPAN